MIDLTTGFLKHLSNAWSTVSETISQNKFFFLSVLLFTLIFGVTIWIFTRSEARDVQGIVTDIVERESVVMRAELDSVRKTNDELSKKIGQLESQISKMENEIQESVKERDILHDAISSSRSIADIDRKLKAGGI